MLERGDVADTWARQRWDSFCLNSNAVLSLIPGDEIQGRNPNEFWRRDRFVGYLQSYAEKSELPIQRHCPAISVDKIDGAFQIETADGFLSCRNVVVASGSQQIPVYPTIRAHIASSVFSIHAAEYRRPDALPGGAVLVVGGGQSGAQITEDLLDSGRQIFLATSRVGRIARSYRGRDITDWLEYNGFLDQRVSDLPDPAMRNSAAALISGAYGGRTVSFQSLARRGAKLLGSLQDFLDGWLSFDGNLGENIRFGDEVSAQVNASIEA